MRQGRRRPFFDISSWRGPFLTVFCAAQVFLFLDGAATSGDIAHLASLGFAGLFGLLSVLILVKVVAR